MEGMTDDLSEAEPTSMDFAIAVDDDGDPWILAQHIVTFFRALSGVLKLPDAANLTLGDISEAMEMEGDALELRILNMTTEMGS